MRTFLAFYMGVTVAWAGDVALALWFGPLPKTIFDLIMSMSGALFFVGLFGFFVGVERLRAENRLARIAEETMTAPTHPKPATGT